MATELLEKARKNKADEFYTQMADIEAELHHYKEQFRGKVVFCNCDDPYESNFFKYFAMNFNALGLKKLIATTYTKSPIAWQQLPLLEIKSLDRKNADPKFAYKIEINEVNDINTDGAVDLSDVEFLLKNGKNGIIPLKDNGDFRSTECIELLKQADIIVTNPPFSLFRVFIGKLMEFEKKFLVIGNTNALTYKEIFRLIKENKIRTGNTNFNVGMCFYVPHYWEKFHKIENGRKIVRVSTSCWFTNLDVQKHNEFLQFYKSYIPEEYPKYVNYDAINVDKVTEIPCDYLGAMGVPITFIDKYNPEQFKIIALGTVGSIEYSREIKMEVLKDGQPTGKFTVNAKGNLFRKYDPNIDSKPPAFKDIKTGELYSSIYARIIIKRKGTAQ